MGMNLEGKKARNSARCSRKVATAAGACVVLGGLTFGGLMWQFERPPFDLAKLGRLDTGMSRAQVEAILGPPKTIHKGQWTYARSFSWPIVQIRFGPSGELAHIEYDR